MKKYKNFIYHIVMVLAAFLIVSLFFTSCNITDGAGNDMNPEKSYRIVVIDECEYIYISRRPFESDMAISHKGNCKNEYHKKQK